MVFCCHHRFNKRHVLFNWKLFQLIRIIIAQVAAKGYLGACNRFLFFIFLFYSDVYFVFFNCNKLFRFVLLVIFTKVACCPFGDSYGCFVSLLVSKRIALLLSGVRLKLLWFNDLTKLLPRGQACLPPNKLTSRKPTRDQHANRCFQGESSKLSLWRLLE